MKKLLTLFTIILAVTSASADKLDSLKQIVKVTENDSLKAPLYAQIAAEYMYYDTVVSRVKKLVYQNEAIINSYQSLRLYSKYSDTTGMMVCFNNLAKVYHSQQRYSQAKWYILQSNTLSRMKNDVPNIIASLIKLAAIKTDIKEYVMAKQDLEEAMALSKLSSDTGTVALQKTYTRLKGKMNKKSKPVLTGKKSPAIVAKKSKQVNGSAKTLAKATNTSKAKKKPAAPKAIAADTAKKLAAI